MASVASRYRLRASRVVCGRELGEVPQARGRDGGGRTVVDPVGTGRDVKIPGRNQATGTAGEPAVGVALGDAQVGRILRCR